MSKFILLNHEATVEKLPGLKGILASAGSGYQTGLHWKDRYVPGGPFVCSDHSKLCNKAWLDGFHEGIKNNPLIVVSNSNYFFCYEVLKPE